MAIIENFATVTYTSDGVLETKVSNLAQIEIESSFEFSKITLGDTYSENSPITYVLSVTNGSSSTVSNIVIEDNLGTFEYDSLELTPLSFNDPVLLLINGQDFTAELTVDTSVEDSVTFSFPSLAAGATANIIYTATPNQYAPLSCGSTITNTADMTSNTECANGTADATVSVLCGADVEVVKTMSPNPVVCGDTLTYTIRIYNYGNLPAESVQLTDTFTPAPSNITVYRNGTPLAATSYDYTDGTLVVPAGDADADTVPAATFTRNESGEVIVTPGVVEYVITGTI